MITHLEYSKQGREKAMFYRVFLCMFLISTMIFIMLIMFFGKIGYTDYKIEPVTYRRYLEASEETTNHIPEVRRNDTFLQRAITRIAAVLKGEFSSKK